MTRSTLALLATLALLLPTACAADDGGTPATPEAADEQDIVSSPDALLLADLRSASKGLFIPGSEGDDDPVKVYSLRLRAGESPTPEILVERAHKKLQGLAEDGGSDYTRSYDESDASGWYQDEAPVRADFETDAEFAAAQATVEKWKALRALVDANLTGVKGYHFGWRSPGGSLETGAVALTIVGQTPSGRVVILYGITIWT